MTAVRGMVGLRVKGLPRERYSAVGTHFAGLLLLQARFVPSFPLSIPTPIFFECYFAHAVLVYLHAAAVLQLLLGTCLLSLSSVSVTSLSQPSLLNARYYQYLHTLLRSYTVMLLNTLTNSPPFAVPQLPPLPLPQPPPRLAISGSYFQRLLPTAEFRQHKITPVAV
ncbi:hypothetical protein HYE67_003525 [Fusarium culmorum]|uniref:Uncharacterized protein n=1 Tax=Fusarium culmorum TaxID=5516 RepID=A0A2T4GQ38_FUSCU|nr:hypothetical protein FCULG_00000663 [Fusarium culmorum]QPC61294.1 hypothetical protein HYE67_003525 [Fusarium culmorum]